MKRRTTAAVAVGAVVFASAAGWIGGSRITSPAEVAAATGPPDAAPILVPAEQRVLSTDIVTRGTARFGSPATVSLPASAVKVEPGVVTAVPAVSTLIDEGEVLMSVSGRPVFVLAGDTPTYRDLSVGVEGDDVRQLEEALARLGYDPGAVDGRFDAATAVAVSSWYESAGQEPFAASADQLAAIRSVELELAQLSGEQLAARDSVATADADLTSANADYAAAAAANSSAPLAVVAARTDATATVAAADADVASMASTLTALQADSSTPPSALAAARADLSASRRSAEAARRSGADGIQAAVDAQDAAAADLLSAVAKVESAQTVLSNAMSLVGVIQAPINTTQGDLSAARSAAGVQVPADEVVFVASLPVRVDQVDVAVGETAAGPVMQVTDSTIAIDSSLAPDETGLVTPGMAVLVNEPALGIDAPGEVLSIADTPGGPDLDGFRYYLEVTTDAGPSVVGASVRLTIPVDSTGGPVLAVPVSALTLAADGTSRVQVQRAGSLEFVTVEPGLSADGLVELVSSGGIAAGDLVVVGFEAKATT